MEEQEPNINQQEIDERPDDIQQEEGQEPPEYSGPYKNAENQQEGDFGEMFKIVDNQSGKELTLTSYSRSINELTGLFLQLTKEPEFQDFFNGRTKSGENNLTK